LPVLEVSGLVTTYGAVRALDGVDVRVAAGSITAVLGANGAGKTTLLRSVNGLVRKAAGSVRLDGQDITRCRPEEVVRLGLAHVPEGRGVITELTVEENLRLGALWRKDVAELKAGLEETYALFPALEQRRTLLAQTLSGGERQMLGIARALMSRPRVLLLDEPSLGLAPLVTAQIMAVLVAQQKEKSLTIVLVEQNARTALSVADRGVVLNVGHVVADDDAAVLAADERLRHAYLGF
jgi:branched-chain amino acid transport system ATP-binding protein